MKIVQFKNGKYGVRKWSFFHWRHLYLDLSDFVYWWYIPAYIPQYCHGSLEQAQEGFAAQQSARDKGVPISRIDG